MQGYCVCNLILLKTFVCQSCIIHHCNCIRFIFSRKRNLISICTFYNNMIVIISTYRGFPISNYLINITITRSNTNLIVCRGITINYSTTYVYNLIAWIIPRIIIKIHLRILCICRYIYTHNPFDVSKSGIVWICFKNTIVLLNDILWQSSRWYSSLTFVVSFISSIFC